MKGKSNSKKAKSKLSQAKSKLIPSNQNKTSAFQGNSIKGYVYTSRDNLPIAPMMTSKAAVPQGATVEPADLRVRLGQASANHLPWHQNADCDLRY